MIYSTQFGGGAPLGSIVQGIGLAEPLYVACDGRAVLRASYPRLSPLFPIGRLTGTVRTLLAGPVSYLLASSPNFFVASAVAGVSAVQYSTDGATWSQASVVTPSITPGTLIFAGNRWLLLNLSAGVSPAVTTGDNPGSTWVSLTGGAPAGVPRYGAAHSTSLGRTVLIGSGSTNTVWTLDNGSTALVARTTPTLQTRSGVCWTGTRFITLNGVNISASTDGITWVDELLPENASGTAGIASNGAGVVVISGVTSGLLVSTDHGATWIRTAIPGVVADNTWLVHYSSDRFFVPTALGVVMSLDGRSWFLEPQMLQTRTVTSMFARRGTAIVQVQSTTLAYSFTESTTAFNAPLLQSFAPVASGNPMPLAYNFIRAL